MSFIISENEKSNKMFEPLPLGPQQAVCSFVEDLGVHEETFSGVTSQKRKLAVIWELAENLTTGEFAGQPFVVSKTFTVSLHEKATLRKWIEAWRGRGLNAEELKAFDIEKLINENCMVNIVSYKKDNGDEGRKIDSIMPLFKGLPRIEKKITACPKWIEERRAKAISNSDLPF